MCGDFRDWVTAVDAPAKSSDAAIDRNAAARAVDGKGAAAIAEVIVGTGEGVDAVVMRSVREGSQLVEELVAVRSADDIDQAVLPPR